MTALAGLSVGGQFSARGSASYFGRCANSCAGVRDSCRRDHNALNPRPFTYHASYGPRDGSPSSCNFIVPVPGKGPTQVLQAGKLIPQLSGVSGLRSPKISLDGSVQGRAAVSPTLRLFFHPSVRLRRRRSARRGLFDDFNFAVQRNIYCSYARNRTDEILLGE